MILLGLLCTYCIQAQMVSPTVVASTGGTYQGANMQLDWTLGELAVTAIDYSTGQLTQGFHQPNYLITNIQELTEEIGQITVFPNPTTDQVQMKLKFDHPRNVKVELFQLDGRVLWTKTLQGYELEITKDVSHLPNAPYFLRFSIGDDQYFKTLVIQKLN